MMSFDQNLNLGGYFTLGRCPEPLLNKTPPSEPRAKTPNASEKVDFFLGRVKLLEATGLPSTPTLLGPENSSGSPRGGFCFSDFSHPLLSNEFKPFFVQIPAEEKKSNHSAVFLLLCK